MVEAATETARARRGGRRSGADEMQRGSKEGCTTTPNQTQQNHTPPPPPPPHCALSPHRIFALLFVAWTLLLLEWHFRQYVALRQFYLRASGGVNHWRRLHMAEADGLRTSEGRAARFAEVVDTARADTLLDAMAAAQDAEGGGGGGAGGGAGAAANAAWWKRTLAWVTSWTGSDGPEQVTRLEAELTAADEHNDLVTRLRGAVGSAPPPLPAAAAAAAEKDAAAAATAAAGPVAEGREAAGRGAGAGAAVGAGELRLDVGGAGGAELPHGHKTAAQIAREAATAAAAARRVAPKWWAEVDAVKTEDGEWRAVTEEDRKAAGDGNLLLNRVRRGRWRWLREGSGEEGDGAK